MEKTDFDEDEERRSQFTGFDLSAYEYVVQKVKTNDGKEFVREKLAKYDENNYPNSCFFHDTPGFLSDLQVSYENSTELTKMKFCQVESLLTIYVIFKKTEKVFKGKNQTLSSKCIYSDPQLSPARWVEAYYPNKEDCSSLYSVKARQYSLHHRARKSWLFRGTVLE